MNATPRTSNNGARSMATSFLLQDPTEELEQLGPVAPVEHRDDVRAEAAGWRSTLRA